MTINAITYENLKVSTFELEYLKELKITNSINNHAKLEMVGVLPNKRGETYIYSTEEKTPIEVHYIDDKGGQNSIFNGVISNVRVKVIEEVYYLYFEAYSFTYLMDIVKRSRSFQNINMTCHEFIKNIVSGYSKADVLINIPNKSVGELVIQYEETDWEFMKRFISRYNVGIIPEIQVPNTKIYISAPEDLVENNLEIKNYTVYKELDKYEEMKKNYTPDSKETDYIIYEIQTNKILKLGSIVKFNEKSFHVVSCSHELVKGILCNVYKMQMKNGLRQKRLYNIELVGASLDGKVLSVSRDKLRVQLDIDGKDGGGSSYWFPYSTMSASPDGSGWYCMPEINDTVRVYIPGKDEKEAFAISAISGHKPEGENDRMGDPSVKYIRTKDDKEVKFTPSGIEINSDSGQAVIKLNEDGSISIIGQNSVNISAGQSINIRAEKTLTISAKDSVTLSSDKGGIVTLADSGDVLIKGTEVKNN